MSNNQHEFAAYADGIYQRESLTLKEIINLARGAARQDWPPDEPFLGLFTDLADAIQRDELPAVPYPIGMQRLGRVRLPDLVRYVDGRSDRWQPIRDVCERWAFGQGEFFEQQRRTEPTVDGPTIEVPEPEPDESEPMPSSPFSADVDENYYARVAEYRLQNDGRRPTREADEAWARAGGITRTRVRALRKSATLPGEEKGGAPNRQNNSAKITTPK